MRYVLDNYDYRHIFRIFNNYFFATVAVVTRTRVSVTFIVHCLCCLMSSSDLIILFREHAACLCVPYSAKFQGVWMFTFPYTRRVDVTLSVPRTLC